MEYLALYRKYRPKNFSEVCGQDFIIKTLKNIIKNNKISHSYLFIGPRGTGKTSTAKIFAKTINCLNPQDGDSCEKCENCINSNKNENIDIIEMDAASNNGVDEIREIRNHVTLMPTSSKYKIYIIDEVHMLSTGAFNALLKTLEEPPKHVIFILATTDSQKVPLTIKSRCQNFEFKPIPKIIMTERLKYICKEEQIKIEDKAIELIAVSSNGGMRDAISLLDQLNSYTNGNIKESDVINMSGRINEEKISKILQFIINNDYEQCFNEIDEIEREGKNFSFVCEDFIKYLKTKLVDQKLSIQNDQILKMIFNFNECINNLKITNDKRMYFDLYVLKNFDIFQKQTNVRIQKEDNEHEKIENSSTNSNNKKVENNQLKKKEKEININVDLYENLMQCRIKNILLDADKKSLQSYIEYIKNIQSNVKNLDDLKIANLLLESNVRAGSKNGILITVNNEIILQELYENLFSIEKLFQSLFNLNVKICFILEDNWQLDREKYIEKIKSKELKYEDETDIIQKIEVERQSQKSEFEDLLEIGE